MKREDIKTGVRFELAGQVFTVRNSTGTACCVLEASRDFAGSVYVKDAQGKKAQLPLDLVLACNPFPESAQVGDVFEKKSSIAGVMRHKVVSTTPKRQGILWAIPTDYEFVSSNGVKSETAPPFSYLYFEDEQLTKPSHGYKKVPS